MAQSRWSDEPIGGKVPKNKHFSSTYFDDNDGLLDNIVDFGLNELDQRGHTLLGRLFDLNGASADGSHRFAHKVHVDLSGVSEMEFEKFKRLVIKVQVVWSSTLSLLFEFA